MPVSGKIVVACFALGLAAPCSQIWAHGAEQAESAPGHAGLKVKPRAGAPADNPFHVDDWFSYGQREADVEKAAPGVQIKAHDPHEDDIIVYGARQRRDFEGAGRDANLTSPQGLDAAQPVVPGIGDSCSYKTGCYDMDQVPLRSAATGLFGGD